MAQASGKTRIENINALVELETLGVKWIPLGSDEVHLCCPIHNDTSPSLRLNTEKNVFQCMSSSCRARGDVITLLAAYASQGTGKTIDRHTMLVDLSTRYDLESVKTINPEVVERFHAKVWEAGPLLKALYDRGLIEQDIRLARIGFHEGRLTIPVYDEGGRIVNVRRYLPGAPGAEKMKNTTGYGQPRLYQIEQTKYQQIVIVGGECKAIVAKRLLNPHGFGVVSVTAGEGSWEKEGGPKFTHLFKDKLVYVLMDIDTAGLVAARKVASKVFSASQAVFIAHLPLDKELYPKGDINDWVAQGATDQDFLDVLGKVEQWYPAKVVAEQAGETSGNGVCEVTVARAASADNIGKRITFTGVVQAMDETPYLIPKDVGVACTRDQPMCDECPVKQLESHADTGYVTITIKGTSRGVLQMVGAPEKVQREAIRESLRIPVCKVAKFAVYAHFNVSDLRIAPLIKLGSDSTDHAIQPALCVGPTVEMNTPYVFSGRVFPHPKNQQAMLVLDDAKQTDDSLASFAPPDDLLQHLDVMQPTEWSVAGIKAKLDEIYADLETNVTRIYQRRDLHLAIDLAYHSALLMEFDGQSTKAWLNLLIIGDSSQGKSEATSRIQQHYGLGERMECKNTSPAGLLGGVAKMGDRWFVTWGVIPTHDRRLVLLEEVKGAPIEVLAVLTDMRSTGIAEVSRIEKRRTHARTRLIFISNPRSDRTVSAYNFGIEAIKELIGSLEDVRRFDLAVVISSEQVDSSEINKLAKSRTQVEHKFTSDLCRRCVLWAWTRKVNQVQFDNDATAHVLEEAIRLCGKFSEGLPLIDRGTTRHKIARLAVALAARTFSTGESLQEIRVRKCHVEMIVEYIERVYSDRTFGYLDFSRAQLDANKILDPLGVKRYLMSTRYPRDLIENMLMQDEINLADIQSWTELDRDKAATVLSFLVRKHALSRVKFGYHKTGEFITLLKQLKEMELPNDLRSGPAPQPDEQPF